ncbi:MAG: cadherin domain-containing protein, partial [Nitrospira sp.]|nr:cadherin domain-containing protein [Nitrospira sp.]
GRFAINSSTGQITVADGSLLDYESASSHGVTVRVTDSGGLTYDETFTINLTNVNEAPTDLSLSANTVTENAMTGTVVGTVTGTDPDAGDTKTYSLIDTAGGRFAIDSSTGQLTVADGSILNYETAASHNVTVRVTDSDGLTYDEVFTVNLTDVNEAPTGADATITINEDTPQTLTTADFGFSDVDAGDGLSAVRIDSLPGMGSLTLSGVAVTAGQVIAVSDITAGNLIFMPATDANGVGYASVTFSVRDSNNAYDSVPNTLTFNVTAVNDAPILSFRNLVANGSFENGGAGWVSNSSLEVSGTIAWYGISAPPDGSHFVEVEGWTASGAPSWIEQTITTVARQTYQFTISAVTRNNYNFGDMGTLSVDGSQVLAFTTGSNWSDYTATFVATSNTATIRITSAGSLSGAKIGSGDGGGLMVDNIRVVEVAPVAFIENGAPVVLNPRGTVVDSELTAADNFNGATLTVTRSGGANTEDVFSGSGTMTLNGGNVVVNGIMIGTYTNGSGTLAMTFNSNATNTLVNSAMQQIAYSNSSNAPPTSVQIDWTFDDGNTSSQGSGGALTDTGSVTVRITAVNDAPTGLPLVTGTVTEDQTLTADTSGIADADGLGAFSYQWLRNGVAIVGATGSTYTLGDADVGTQISVTVSYIDGQGTSESVTSVQTAPVVNVNDIPILMTNTGSTVTEGGTDTINAGELAVTDADNSAAQLAYTIGTGPLHGRLELITAPGINVTTFTQADIAANRLVYIHDGSETTSDSFSFTVNDGAGGTVGATTVTLTITPVNDTPTITSNGGGPTAVVTVAENVSAVTIVTGADVDLPAQTLTYSLSGGADQARFTINATTGALAFTAPPNFEVATDVNGDNVYIVQVQVTDSQGASTTQTIQVTVTDVIEITPPPPAPTVPPVLLSPAPSSPTGGPTPGLGTPAPAAPVIPATMGSGPMPVPSGPTVPSMVRLPVNVEPLSLVPPTDRPVMKVPEEPKRPTDDVGETPLFLVNDDHGHPLFTVLPVEPIPTLEPEPPETKPSVSDLLLTKLDEMTVSLEQAVNVSQERHELMARVAAVTGTTLSVGFVAWALRSGVLLASCLATMPAWRHFDPLPVVKLSRHERARRRDEATRAQQQEAAEFKGLNRVLDEKPPLKRTA